METSSRVQGFTLLELLIAVTIVAIMAAIAIPVYLNYTTRAKVAEALNVVTAPMTAVTEYYSVNGSFPDNNADAGLGAPESFTGEYVLRVSILAGGVIQADLQGSQLSGHAVTLTPASGDAVSWTCGSTLPDHLLPPNCRSTP